MKRQAAILVALALIGLLLGGCGVDLTTANDSEARRIEAQAELERQRSEDRIRERDQSHQQTLELLTYIVIIGAGLALAGGGAGLLIWYLRRQPRPAQQCQQWQPSQAPALPTTINVFVLPPGDGGRRVDYWRQLEAAAKKEVTIYEG